MRFRHRQGRRGRQRLWSRAGVVRRPQPSVPRRKRTRSGNDVYALAATPAPGRERMHAGDNVYARAMTGAAWEGCFFTNTPNFSARATTSASERQRLRPGDEVRARATTSRSCFSNVGIFSCFGNPNKTFPLSLFENY